MLDKKDKFLLQHDKDIVQLAQKFNGYPSHIDKIAVQAFLTQFDAPDMPTALKLLKNIDYCNSSTIADLTRTLGNTVKSANGGSFNDVVFCPLSTTSGDSSGDIMRYLKVTMKTNPPQLFKSNFLTNVTDLGKDEHITNNNRKKIVFVDHFIGSGSSVVEIWGGIQQWQNENYEYYVGVLVAYTDSIKYVEEETNSYVNIIPVIELPEKKRAFHDKNNLFDKNEKEILKKYCKQLRLDPRDKYGYKNGQSLVVFSNRTPDNVLPILHYKTDDWIPLFPRDY